MRNKSYNRVRFSASFPCSCVLALVLVRPVVVGEVQVDGLTIVVVGVVVVIENHLLVLKPNPFAWYRKNVPRTA